MALSSSTTITLSLPKATLESTFGPKGATPTALSAVLNSAFRDSPTAARSASAA